MDGYVYALQGTLNGVEYTKIGKTGNPTHRARQLARQLPFPVTMITQFPCPDESALEAAKEQEKEPGRVTLLLRVWSPRTSH